MKPDHTPYQAIYIEDNPGYVRLMEEIFNKRTDVNLQVALDAETGIEMVAKQQPDFVLMDINLPGISGIDALGRLQLGLQTRNIPVVAVTANDKPKDVRTGLDVGFHDYLTKPMQIAEVSQLIDQLIDYLRQRDQNAEVRHSM